ncbi:MAG TPA: alginate lyase family protein [Vicinamibacterales bacterium]
MDNASSLPLESSILGSHAERYDRGYRHIRDMRVAELAYRGWQEASKWLERVAPIELPDRPDVLLRKQAPELARPEAAIHILRHLTPQRFFAGAEDTATAGAIDARLPDYRRDLLAHADGLVKRHFDLLGYRTLWFGDPIDWHLDPLRSRRAPAVAWSLIDVRDAATVGDSRLIWELNRHQWLVSLAQAWTLTGDERYAAACVSTIDAWLDANPPGVGINWASSLEVALRTISWCWTLLLLRDARVVSAAWLPRVLAAIWLHATHIRRYLSYYCSRNTDLTGEALGLFYVATVFPEFRDADRWRDVAVRILVSESDEQVCGDGVHFERSTCYHRYIADTYLHFVLLAHRNGVELPHCISERVQQMVEFLLAIRQPDGTIPALGDDDGGSLLPLRKRSNGDICGLFGVAATRFHRPDFAWASGGLTPEVLWLLGRDGMHAFDTLKPAPPAISPSCVFPSGGYASMRSDWTPDSHHAILDIGPIGCPVSGGHGHADLLSIQCSIFGEPCLVDAGTYCYAGEPQWRDYFRSTAAHSTVIVDGVSQADPAGPFGWQRQPRVRLREWHSTPEFDFLDAEHDGYLLLPDPVVHRRRVIFVKPGYWIVVDDLSGSSRHQLDLTFQFGPLSVALATHPWARAQTPNGRVLWICPFPSAPVQPALKCGELAPINGWISRGYGERQPAPMLIYSFVVALPWRIVTLLLPDRQGLASPPSVRAVYDDAGRPTGVAFERPRRLVRFSDCAISVERD